MATIQDVKDQLVVHFQKQPSALVTGLGIGSQPDAVEQPADQAPAPYIIVFVEPVPDCKLQPLWDEVKAQSQGQPFLLLRTGRFVGLMATTGTSIGPYVPSRYNVPPSSAGTVGAILAAAGKEYALSSNHVLAFNGRVPLSAPVIAPATLDDPYGRSVVGRLAQFVPLHPAAWPFNGTPDNKVDCALAEITPPNSVSHGASIQVAAPVRGVTRVRKQGRTTGLTRAAACIWSMSGTPIDLSFGTYCFSDLMATLGSFRQGALKPDPFAAPGDSGALVLTDPGNQALGLVTARAYSSGVFTPNPPAPFLSPPQGAFVGYIVALCSMASVRDALASRLRVQPSQINLFE